MIFRNTLAYSFFGFSTYSGDFIGLNAFTRSDELTKVDLSACSNLGH